MSPVLFWIFSGLMLAFGLMVVFHRNPVTSAVSLVVSFIGLAVLFVSLDAFFIGIIQILVYAGAVMVLFLFIIMLLDLKTETARKFNPFGVAGGVLIAVAFGAIVIGVLQAFPAGNSALPALQEGPLDDVRHVGMTLFTDYNLPLQIIGTLVLVATLGVVILSKKELK
jgi:NADH-quinone oxidoreductase subunit J